MNELNKIHHREQQVQWHEDKIHSLETGEPMREWEVRRINSSGHTSEWLAVKDNFPSWLYDCEYRRKPRTVTYWHCAVRWEGKDNGIMSSYDEDKFILDVSRVRAKGGMDIELGPIIETTVELED